MLTWNQSSLLTVLMLALFLTTGCGKGKSGPPGAPGSSVSNRIVLTINCSGTITGSIAALNGLEIEYTAVETAAGDVYATANVIDLDFQVSGTSFYSAGQSGSSTAPVLITADYHGALDGGYFDIGVDRESLVTTAVYTDDSVFGSPLVIPFAPDACDIQLW